jgi:hypothetical protein
MAKRSIDMLPLLDVFMVVLFVFATIQEGQLDDTSSQLEQAENARIAADSTAADPDTRELTEVAVVHEQLLNHIAVFELEIAGERQPNQVLDHCCVRADPPRGEWRRCGVIPTGDGPRADWFDDGGEGLRDVLRETRDGYAIVLLKQDLAASYQVSKDVARLLHERLRGHYVYDNGLSDGPLSCPLLPRE